MKLATIDGLISTGAIPAPAVVKVDVEGSEIDVFDGMKDTIETSGPILIYEVDDVCPELLEERWLAICKKLVTWNYTVQRLEDAYPKSKSCVAHGLAVPSVFQDEAEVNEN